MKTTKNIARIAVTAGLTAALSFGGVMAPVTMAFAEGTPTVAQSGNVTIDEQTYTDTTFKGIQIFKAKVTQDLEGASNWNGSKTLSDIEWASDAVRDAVTGAFTDTDDTTKPSGTDAQQWADWINSKTKSEYTSGTDSNTKLDAETTLDKIAKALEGASITEGTDECKASTDGAFTNLNTGYWLFVTKSAGTTNKSSEKVDTDTFTSPIFTVVGGSAETIVPKKRVPTVTKAVRDDKDGSTFGIDVFTNPNKAADSASGQPVDYQLAGTVASNINTYDKYSYTFTDELPTTMEPELGKDGKPAVVVKIDEAVVKSDCYSVNYAPGTSKNVLTVSFGNLKEVKDANGNDITVNGDSKVYVNYQAKLVASKITESILGTAQTNTVKLTYSNNPHVGGTGDTVVHPAYDYTYGIDVTKVGSDEDGDGNLKKLKDVEFTLQEVVDGAAQNQFIDAQGVKHDDAKDATLKTTGEGKINVVGLDEGTYILKEVEPAPGYNNSAKNGVTFIIKRDSNSQLYQAGQNVSPSTDSVIDAAPGVVKDGTATASTGKLSFTIVDKKGSNLPLTGLNGVTFTWIAGGAVLCIGVAHLIRSRKRDEGSEE